MILFVERIGKDRRIGKTEFPDSWDIASIEQAIIKTWQDPDRTIIKGDIKTVQKMIDGALIEVAAYGDNYSISR